MQRKRFTIGDVARLAGVGKVTVSYVLNGRGEENRISKETQERIFAAARELEYRPSAVARSLVSKRANAISIVFQYANYFRAGSSFVNELMRGVCEECVDADINLILHTRSFDSVAEEADALMDGRTDGALILRDFDDPLLEVLHQRQFPIVTFFSHPNEPSIPFVDADNVEGGITATQHMIELGHRHIGMVTGSPGSVASNDRCSGYQQALRQFEVEVNPSMIISSHAPGDFEENFATWFKTNNPTALVCWSDDIAFACIKILTKLGASVPDDVSVIGFDSSEECNRTTPPLTSMRQPIFDIARSAARTLIAATRLEPADVNTTFPLTLDVRGSTKQHQHNSSSMKRTS
ncbi:MAG: LacI family DNA-binding transcriptional regulator [Armatimonadetes bacterium]|nr:LacI family DNA-binding transcriptional regulator [Armatimonadota bacterium]